MTKLHESHTKDRFTHMIVSVLKQIKSWTCVNPEQIWTSGYENVTTSAKYFIGRMINEIQILRKAHRLSAVCVCSLEIHFSYLWSHTQTHRHTNIFPHGKVSRIVSSGQQRISQLIQHHTKSLSSLLASPNKLSGETSKQNKAPWVQQLVRPAPNQTIRSTAQSEGL